MKSNSPRPVSTAYHLILLICLIAPTVILLSNLPSAELKALTCVCLLVHTTSWFLAGIIFKSSS